MYDDTEIADPEHMDDVTASEFEAILHGTQPRIRAYIAGLGVAAHEVDDLAQDVYLELYRNFERMPLEVEPERWLKGIARNLCMNHFRKTTRRKRLHRKALGEILARAESDLLETHHALDLDDVLAGCCTKLPERSRRLLSMKYEDELSSADIAEATDTTAEAVRIALYRIRANLRDCIVRQHRLATNEA